MYGAPPPVVLSSLGVIPPPHMMPQMYSLDPVSVGHFSFYRPTTVASEESCEEVVGWQESNHFGRDGCYNITVAPARAIRNGGCIIYQVPPRRKKNDRDGEVPSASYRWPFNARTHAYLLSSASCFGGPQSASSGLSSALAGVSSCSLFPWESNAYIRSKARCTIGNTRRLLVWAKSSTAKPNRVVMFRVQTGLVQRVSLVGAVWNFHDSLERSERFFVKCSLLVRKESD